jgi:hypothetical protein
MAKGFWRINGKPVLIPLVEVRKHRQALLHVGEMPRENKREQERI